MPRAKRIKHRKTVAYKAFLNGEQAAYANLCALARVKAWNHVVEHLQPHFAKIEAGKINPWDKNKKDIFDFNRLLAEMKTWRKQDTVMFQVPYELMRHTLEDVKEVYLNWLRHICEQPKLKDPSDKNLKKTFQLEKRPTKKREPIIKRTNDQYGKIRLSEKFGWVAIELGPEWDNPDITKLTVRENNGQWQVIAVWEIPDPKHPKNDGSVGAIDVGGKHAFALHNGEIHDLPERSTYLENKSRGIQARLDKKQKGSNRKAKMGCKKKYWNGKETHSTDGWINRMVFDIAPRFDTIYVENMDKKEIKEQDWGGREAKGKRKSKSKRDINRKMSKNNLGKFIRKLSEKTTVIKVPSPYTSRDCPTCGHRDKKNRQGEKFECAGCGRTEHADVNAAVNILKRGLIISGRTSGSIPASVKERIHPASNGLALESRLAEDLRAGALEYEFIKSNRSDERSATARGNSPPVAGVSKPDG